MAQRSCTLCDDVHVHVRCDVQSALLAFERDPDEAVLAVSLPLRSLHGAKQRTRSISRMRLRASSGEVMLGPYEGADTLCRAVG